MSGRIRRRWWGGLVALPLVFAACGGGERSATNPGESPDSEDTFVEGEVAGMFGDLPSPCGPEEGPLQATGDQGVTADSVVIGYGDDAGYQAAPGLNQQMSDAMRAMIAWCNAQGGINGRQIVGEYYDAKLLDVTNAVTEACGEVFFMVGHGFALDGAAEQARVSCGLPQVPGYTVSSTVAHGPLTYNSVPNPVDFTPAGMADLMAEEFPEAVQQAAVLYGDYAATRESTQKVLDTYPEFGWAFLPGCEQTYPIAGVAQWAPYVQKLQDCGAEVVYFSGSPMPNFQNLLDAAAQADYDPIWVTDSNFYDQNFANANQSGRSDNVYVRSAFVPFEQADANLATDQYLRILEERGGEPALLGAQATSSFLLWATAADACGADLTRQCVLDELSTVSSWTGGGLHAETNPAANMPPECAMVLRLQGTGYVQALPEERGEFACDPSYIAPVSPDVPAVVDAQLGPDRISQAFAR